MKAKQIKNRLIGEIITVSGIIIIILGVLLLTGCVTDRQITRNCDRFVDICKTDTRVEYRDTVIYITDTILFKLPADTVTLTDTVTIIRNQYCYMPPLYENYGVINVLAGVDNSRLYVSAWLADSTILIAHTDTVHVENAFKKESEVIVVPERYVPKIYRFFLVFGIGVLVMLLIIVLKKIPFRIPF